MELASGTTNTMSKTLAIVLKAVSNNVDVVRVFTAVRSALPIRTVLAVDSRVAFASSGSTAGSFNAPRRNIISVPC